MAGIRAEIDANVTNYLRDFAEGLDNAIRFGAEQARVALVTQGLLGAEVELIGSVEGFPASYLHHLIVAIYRLPINVTSLGGGVVEATLSLGLLGDEGDLDKGRHHNAMLAANDDGDFKSFRISTKGLLQRVQLPYDGEELLNSEEDRMQWWNENIVGGATPYTMVGRNWGWTKIESRTQEANAWIAENVPTYEQVASARANMWSSLGVAPQWLLLEYGTPAFYGSGDPVIEPQNFTQRIADMMGRVCQEYVDKAVVAFERLLAERNVIGVKGPQSRPYNTLGQFVEYKDLLL